MTALKLMTASLVTAIISLHAPALLAQDELSTLGDGESLEVSAAGNGQIALDSLSPEGLNLEAFPALKEVVDALSLDRSLSGEPFVDVLANAADSRGLDVNASYVWESPRFGQFVLSTNTTYLYSPVSDLSSDNQELRFGSRISTPEASLLGNAPSLNSSLTFTWQFGNHSATAVTSYANQSDLQQGRLNLDSLNLEQLNELVGEIATLDLRYGYELKTGDQSSASFSFGFRNRFNNQQRLVPAADASPVNTEPDRMAYGTIKYQF